MLREKDSNQGRLELVNIEDLVPADHLLRKIDKFLSNQTTIKPPKSRAGKREVPIPLFLHNVLEQVKGDPNAVVCPNSSGGYMTDSAFSSAWHSYMNHIVLNSVSFANGKKYHSTAQSYFREVRPISDRLCKEHGLSIIMESTGKAMSYVEWKLKQAGVYTEREFFELDLEECMANASEPGEVYSLMEARGYTVAHNSKYPTFTPHKSTHAYRAKRQGKSLTEDELFGIIDHDLRFGTEETLLCKREYVHCRPQVRITGYITIFPYWMYVLGFVGQGKRTNYRIDYSEVKKLKRYIKDHDFIEKYGIDNEDQLDAKERSINEEIERLTKQSFRATLVCCPVFVKSKGKEDCTDNPCDERH